MKENKNQLREATVMQPFNAPVAVKDKKPSVLVTAEQVITTLIQHMDLNNKLNRRYSFDDNGGGYAGL